MKPIAQLGSGYAGEHFTAYDPPAGRASAALGGGARPGIISIVGMGAEMWLISATDTAETVERALACGDEAAAVRHLTEAISRIMQAPGSTQIPLSVLAAPAPNTDERYSTLIATAFAYAMLSRGETPRSWMTDVQPLESEWLWGGDGASEEFRDFIRRNTPETFRSKNVLTHARDWATL